MVNRGRKTEVTLATGGFHKVCNNNREVKHITAHNSGPWARTEVIVVPFESTQQDLTSYMGPGTWEGQQRVVMRGQRYKMMKSHGPGDISAHNSGPWPRKGTRIGPSESTHQDLSDYGGPGAWGFQKRIVLRVSKFSTQKMFRTKTENKNWSLLGAQFCPGVENLHACSPGSPASFWGAPGARKTRKIIKIMIFRQFFQRFVR